MASCHEHNKHGRYHLFIFIYHFIHVSSRDAATDDEIRNNAQDDDEQQPGHGDLEVGGQRGPLPLGEVGLEVGDVLGRAAPRQLPLDGEVLLLDVGGGLHGAHEVVNSPGVVDMLCGQP